MLFGLGYATGAAKLKGEDHLVKQFLGLMKELADEVQEVQAESRG
jgi:hypothetical protein